MARISFHFLGANACEHLDDAGADAESPNGAAWITGKSRQFPAKAVGM